MARNPRHKVYESTVNPDNNRGVRNVTLALLTLGQLSRMGNEHGRSFSLVRGVREAKTPKRPGKSKLFSGNSKGYAVDA